MSEDRKNIIEVKHLKAVVREEGKETTLLHDSSFVVHEGECLGILGESGSGKSLTMQAFMGLLDEHFTITGEVLFEGKDLLKESGESLRRLRGSKLAMVMQNPMTSFDPLLRIEEQVVETFVEHTDWSRSEIVKRTLTLFDKLQIRDPAEALKKYPHQLSGGMLQRIMIGIALLLEPRLLIADEPTTALDALTQFEVLKEFRKVKDGGTAMVFITHDLGVASYIADRIVVMNKGRIVDTGTFHEIVDKAKDQYTRLLIEKKTAVMRRYEAVMKGGAASA
ncbi:ABC transporter ATP-binding protein [uncultured Selenomonas sp.]|uniref:ABC transporter ATP-binding protein n=1 Tax=uncultured Selenomonas sp. TaxID=159275 RepID=UPI0028DB47C4|nr:ABC transporter ATP-binding protein [uncultured Selenomonas sp.]